MRVVSKPSVPNSESVRSARANSTSRPAVSAEKSTDNTTKPLSRDDVQELRPWLNDLGDSNRYESRAAYQISDNIIHYVSAEDIVDAFLQYIELTSHEHRVHKEIFYHVRRLIEMGNPGIVVSQRGSGAMGLELPFR
jgi:hypothetical protein